MSDPLLSGGYVGYLLFDWLGIRLPDGLDRSTVSSILEMVERLGRDQLLPHYREIDRHEPYLEAGEVRVHPAVREGLRRYGELGLFGTTFAEEAGGMGLPFSIGMGIYAMLSSADISTMAYPLLTAANARLLLSFGNEAQVRQFALPQVEGRWFGTMCLSEPQAGSSLADVATRAVAEGRDEFGERYLITGNKMWISGGDQDASENIVHLVLAKVVGDDGRLPVGTGGISLFIVPKVLPDGARNDVAVAGLNHKMGYRGVSNCLLNFGEAQGAVGWRVGAEGQGLAQMFLMMNEARIAVGTGAAALAYRGYRHAARYAGERIQGRPPGAPAGPPQPIVAHADVRRMLMQQKAYSEGSLALCLYCAVLADDGSAAAEALLSLLTPVCKTWPSEFGLTANDLAIQIHGGYGYTRDFDVEQLYRDNRLNAIHEGTTGIQGIDLLRRKILRSDGAGLAELGARIVATCREAAGDAQLAPLARGLEGFWDRTRSVIRQLADAEEAHAFDGATYFLRAFGHGVVGWLWLDQAVAAVRADHAQRLAELVHTCRFFFEAELPEALVWYAVAVRQGQAGSAIPAEVFAEPAQSAIALGR